MAAYNRKVGEESLNAISCDVSSSTNNLSCGVYSVVDNQALETNIYPGAYPSIIMDGSHFYIAYQQGETTFHYIRLSDCTLGSSNAFTCSNQTVATHTGTNGLGMMPRLSIVGSGAGARLWMSYLGSSSESSWVNGYFEVRYCTLQSSSPPSCSSTPYFTSPIIFAGNVLTTRGHFIDVMNNVMIVPQLTSNNRKVGTVSLGLIPEL
jgi:hypothetical protein